MSHAVDFTGYVLTGGKSSRMGADKAFLKLNGETFLSRAVKELAPNCAEVKIVLNRRQTDFIKKLPAGISYIFDVHENRGAPGGIHAALKNCRTKFAVILAVDLPFVNTEAIKKLCEIALSSSKYPAAIPRQTDERPQPLCAVYRPGYCLPPLEKLLGENDFASVNDFLEQIHPRFFNANLLSQDENLLFNVNRQSDFKKISDEL